VKLRRLLPPIITVALDFNVLQQSIKVVAARSGLSCFLGLVLDRFPICVNTCGDLIFFRDIFDFGLAVEEREARCVRKVRILSQAALWATVSGGRAKFPRRRESVGRVVAERTVERAVEGLVLRILMLFLLWCRP